MRIRDRLMALATASLAPSRAQARGPVDDEPPAALPNAGEEPEAPAARPELPRQLGEQLLQSIHTSRQRLMQTADALATIASALAAIELTARELYERRAARPISTLAVALAAANSRASDGTFLFPGTGSDPPFAADGSYLGPISAAVVIVLPGPPPQLAVPAAALTCLAPAPSAGDVLPRLARAQLACHSGSPRALEGCREPLAAASSQLAYLQGRVASALTVLSEAIPLAADSLPVGRAPLPAADSADAGRLAQAFSDLEAARSLAERTLAIFPTV
jgi:hypothetical protein